MKLDFTNNYFQLFELPRSMQVDEDLLDKRYKLLQRKYHPDRFSNGSQAEKRWSMQAASLLNQAKTTLADPLLRATYLLTLEGIDLNSEIDTHMSNEFLVAQMQLREELEKVSIAPDPFAEIEKLSIQIKTEIKNIQSGFENAIISGDTDKSRSKVREWQFLKRINNELQVIEMTLENKLL